MKANVDVHLQEVALCGHATLAASQAVFSINPAFETIEFTTRFSGVLTAKKVEDKQVEITLPSLPKNVLEAFGGKSSKEDLTKVGSVFGVKEEEIVAVSPFAFGTRSSVIVSLSPQVDLAKIKASEADLVGQSCIGFALSHRPACILQLAFSDGMIIVTQVAREQPDDQLHINSRVFAPGLEIADWIRPCVSHWVLCQFTADYQASSEKVCRQPAHDCPQRDTVEQKRRKINLYMGRR